MVGGSSRIPRVRKLLSTMFGGKEVNIALDPDHAVAFGAALQASVLINEQVRISVICFHFSRRFSFSNLTHVEIWVTLIYIF